MSRRRTKSRRRTPAVTRRRALQIKRLKVKLAWLRKEYRKVQAFIRSGRARRNPKRDGTPTRGEVRQGKYQEYLRQLSKAGQAAHAQLLRLQGRGGSANEPHPEPALKAERTATQEAHPGHYAPAAAEGEPAEAKFIRQGLEDVRVLRNDFMAQLKELGDSDENAAEAEAIQAELIDLAKKERKIKAKAAEVGLTLTNPGYYRRRRNSGRSYYRNPGRGRRKWAAQHVSKVRARGGHEEGGWYYDAVSTSHRRTFKRPGAAAAYAKRLSRRTHTPRGDWDGPWDSQETIQHGRKRRLLKDSGRPRYNPKHRRSRSRSR